MPTPQRSRASSEAQSRKPSTPLPDTAAVEWDANVLSYISTCLHPGLVRRTSSVNTKSVDGPERFRRQHRRNLSTATTVGYERCLDPQWVNEKSIYPLISYSPGSHGPPLLYRRFRGHVRNISDPTAGWDHVIRKPVHVNQLMEKPYLPFFRPTLTPEYEAKMGIVSDSKIDVLSFPYDTKDSLDPDPMSTSFKEPATFPDRYPCSCNSPCSILIGLCLIMFMQSMVVSGLMSSMFTTLERRFNLNSRQIGFMISCYEVTGVITTVGISFLNGQKHNRLRVIGLATLILAFGFGLFALPHFLSGPYQPTQSSSLLSLSVSSPILSSLSNEVSSNADGSLNGTDLPASASGTDNFTDSVDSLSDPDSPNLTQSLHFPIFCMAMLLAGIGASPLYVLAPTYLWDNLTEKQYPIYAGLFYSAGALGPACGFLAGAGFLSIYIDSPLIRPRHGLNRNSPLWLGAWWLGMLVCASLTFLVALPVITFPKQLTVRYKSSSTDPENAVSTNELKSSQLDMYPTVKNSSNLDVVSQGESLKHSEALDGSHVSYQQHKPSIFHSSGRIIPNWKKRIRSSILILRRVLTNPIWLGVTITTVVEQSIVAAFLTFVAKYIQNLFHIPAYLASIHTGAVVVPSSLLGVLSGALMMRHIRPLLHHTLIGVSATIAVTVITTVSLMTLSCPTNRVAGLTATYDGNPWPWKYGPGFLMPPNLTAPCNTFITRNVKSTSTTANPMSHCSVSQFDPVCWRRKPGENLVGPNYMTFFNPCFAGCHVDNAKNLGVDGYSNCRCMSGSSLDRSNVLFQNAINTTMDDGEVIPGRCEADCPLYGVFLSILFLHILCTGILQNPSNVITLSCVSQEDSSVALGLQIFFVRTLASIPAPIYFGQLFDLACQYRVHLEDTESDFARPSLFAGGGTTSKSMSSGSSQTLPLSNPSLLHQSQQQQPQTHNQQGACLEYNLEGLPLIWLGAVFALKVISLCGALITWTVARKQYKSTTNEVAETADESKTTTD